MSEPQEQFRTKMLAAGLDFRGPLVPDGRLHRFTSEGDHSRNSWYVLYAGTPAAGAFGCWKRGIKETWCERTGQLSEAERNEARRHWQDAERQREQSGNERHAKAQKFAARIVQRAKRLTTHGYIMAKRVKVFGDVREHRGALVLPLQDANGELHSLQFISADGSKHFLTGGRIAGCFFLLFENPDLPLVICEGYATGASIHESTGFAVVDAIACGNLLDVAKALRENFPVRQVIIAADNDQYTASNPGVTKATEAAKAIGARLAVPQFADVSSQPTHFNDLAALEGLGAVTRQIESATSQPESDEEILHPLATLPSLEYERRRGKEAKTLGCCTAVLDKLVGAKRVKPTDGVLQGGAVDLVDPELWPEPVNGADVLNETVETFLRYIVLPVEAAWALALWCVHAHVFEIFDCSPRLNISSPEKGCGKTTLRDVLAEPVPRPLSTENLSVAVLFRVIESHSPTMLADECDAWLRDNDELRGMAARPSVAKVKRTRFALSTCSLQ